MKTIKVKITGITPLFINPYNIQKERIKKIIKEQGYEVGIAEAL